MQNHHTEAAQNSANLEALENWVAVTKDVLVHARLREVRADLQTTHEQIATLRGNWYTAIVKPQELDSEVVNVRPQIQLRS